MDESMQLCERARIKPEKSTWMKEAEWDSDVRVMALVVVTDE